MPDTTKTRGQQIVEEWLLIRSRFVSDADQFDLVSRIDAELSKKRTMDLTGYAVKTPIGRSFLKAIRAQLPDVEVKT